MRALFVRELRLSLQAGGGAGTALLFFFAVVIIVPFGVGPNPDVLAGIGPAILWVAALLASLLGLDRLFRPDFEDGSLDQYLIGRPSLFLVCLIKAIAHFVLTGLPIVVAVPLLGAFLTMPADLVLITSLTLLIGSPAFSFIGTAGAAVAVALPRGGLLVSVLVLPLCVPTIIFGVGAVRALASKIDSVTQPILFLAALSLAFAVLGPLAASASLRQATT